MKIRLISLFFVFALVLGAISLVSCDHEHTLKKVNGKDATEEAEGYLEYWQCSDCEKMFSDSNGKNEIDSVTKTEKLSHDLTLHSKIAPSEENEGVEAYYTCANCEKMFSDADAKNQINAPVKIPKLTSPHEHVFRCVDRVKPTCQSEGKEAYWQCIECEKMFSDKDGKTEINVAITIAKASHVLRMTEREEPTYERTGTEAYYTCSVCNKMFSDNMGENQINAPITIPTLTPEGHTHVLSYVPQTYNCTQAGNDEYYVCECGKMFSDREGRGEISSPTQIPATHVLRCHTDYNKKWLACDCGAQSNSQKELFSANTFTYSNTTVKYREYIPENASTRGDKLPLILFMHGAGERGDNNTNQLNNAIRIPFTNDDVNYANSVVIAPQCPSDKRWVEWEWNNGNYTTAQADESELLNAVYQLVKTYSEYSYIDETRVYVIGLSMGGFATWNLLANHSDLFAAGMPICGGAPIDKVDVLKNIPIYTFHGTADNVVPYNKTTPVTVKAIKDAGGNKINYVEFIGDGHVIWDKAIVYAGNNENPNVITWLFSQHK